MKGNREHWPSFARRTRRLASKRIENREHPSEEIASAMKIPDAYSRAMALSGIFRDLCNAGMKTGSLWKDALASAKRIEPEWKKEEVLEKMLSWGAKCGMDVSLIPDIMEDRELRMKLVSKLVRISDEEGMLGIWKLWNKRPEKDRYELLRIMVHNGFPGYRALKLAEELPEGRRSLIESYISSENSSRKSQRGVEVYPEIAPLESGKSVFTMALYNTYSGKAGEIHYRSISRAAALCYAFDLNLALISFPFKDLEECIERTLSYTRIGDGSEYLRALFSAGRLELHRSIEGVEGILVATTPKPEDDKYISSDSLKEGMVFLMGLGHQGLPPKILEKSRYHLEFTGKNASLETCTAMGVLAHILYTHRKAYIPEE